MRNNLLKNKRGSIQDIFFFIVIVFTLAIFFIIAGYAVSEITDKIKETPLNDSANARIALGFSEDVTERFDPIFLFLFFGLIIGILISSFMIDSHPIFIPIYIILLGISVVVGVIMNNVYDKFIENTDLAATAATHTFSNAIINNYVLIIIGVGILSMIIIFGKARSGDRI